LGAASVIVVRRRGQAGGLAQFLPASRVRTVPQGRGEAVGKLIRCPYHAFAFAAADGRLVSTAHAVPTDDFDRGPWACARSLHRVWNGFLFLNLSADPGEIWSDVGLHTLDNWPMDALSPGITGRHDDRLQLEGLLGKLLGMPALSRHPPRTVRSGADLSARDHGAERSAWAGRRMTRRFSPICAKGGQPGRWTVSPADRSSTA
jgi:nitrite reductase/ring-hydroxylating ferredoxin subunit